jgi:hypothetical protein
MAAPTTTVQRRPAQRPIRLAAVAAYDPDGDGRERDDVLRLAVDGDATTSWTTERYDSWGWKDGVGLVLDASRPVRLARLVVSTDTPGFRAEIRAASSPEGPFEPVSAVRGVGPTTAFTLEETEPLRYRLVWITQLAPDPTQGGAVHVNEVRALAR